MLATLIALTALHHSMTPRDCSAALVIAPQRARFRRNAENNFEVHRFGTLTPSF
jgi:hypothetical protein